MIRAYQEIYLSKAQAALAQASGVALRSIQMYEQRRKDINKASVETLYRFARVLGCAIEDLVEKRPLVPAKKFDDFC